MANETMEHMQELQQLGVGAIGPGHLDTLVARALHTPVATVEHVAVRPVSYPIGTIATEALDRIVGTALDANATSRPFSIFVKQLHSAACWPFIDLIPDFLRQEWIEDFPWRIEIDAFQVLPGLLPEGLRMAELYDVVEIDADHAAIWMEDVQHDDAGWTTDRFERAARLLGELAGRRPASGGTALGGRAIYQVPGMALRQYADGRIRHLCLPALVSDAAWDKPFLAELLGSEFGQFRTSLIDLGTQLDAILDRLDQLPQAYAHGDASPQNLLVPEDDETGFVAIDWGFNTPQAVGFDLSQLLFGLVNCDQVHARLLGALAPRVVDAYTEGLRSTGFAATTEDVWEGFALSAIVRDAFTTLGLDEPAASPDIWTREHAENRLGIARFLLALPHPR